MTANTLNLETMDSDELHNINCFIYLSILRSALPEENSVSQLPDFAPLFSFPETYDANFAYGDLYTSALTVLENTIEHTQSAELDALVDAVYLNDNSIIEQTQTFINEFCPQTTPSNNPQKVITTTLKDTGHKVNRISPYTTNELTNVLTVWPNYKPQNITNIPSIRHFSYKHSLNDKPIEIRMSTQVQRHKGQLRISPLFKRWLELQAAKYENKSIVHLYVNNLGLDRQLPDIAGYLEQTYTKELHKVNDDPLLKVALVTLPSAKGLMNHAAFKVTKDIHSYQEVYDQLIQIVLEQKNGHEISDFYISENVKQLLFPENNREQVFKALLQNTFDTFGIDSDSEISTAKRQALMLHFIKFEVTNFIIDTLQPMSINFSCKDGIDRGAVSSAYYNLMKSFTLNDPITQDEFETALNAPATNARGRGLNFHREIIWNAIDAFVQAQYYNLINDPEKAWLIYWRDMNCPHARVPDLLRERSIQFQEQIDQLPKELSELKLSTQNIHANIQEQIDLGLSGQRLLLEAMSRTSAFLINPYPNKNALEGYLQLADEMPIRYPRLTALCGLMKAFLGVLLYPFTKHYWQQGVANFKAGFFANKKEDLQIDMQTFIDSISPKNS